MTPAQSKETRNAVNADGNALARRMIAAYQSAQTYQETSEAKIQEAGKSEYIQQTTLRFKRPNLLYLSSEDPSIGTYSGYCNGKIITLYSGASNIYTKRNSPAALRPTMEKLSAAGESLLRIPITLILNPLGFVSAKGMPDECKNFQFVRFENYEGNRVAVVSGQADSAWIKSLGTPPSTLIDRKTITLWIDTNAFLLRKAVCDLRWRLPVKSASGKPASMVPGGIHIVEAHRTIRVNVPLRDEDFFFEAPKGAVEKVQERR